MYPIDSPIEACFCVLLVAHHKCVPGGDDFCHIGATNRVAWKMNGPFSMIQWYWIVLMVYVLNLCYFKR